jgi:hypothetical protein
VDDAPEESHRGGIACNHGLENGKAGGGSKYGLVTAEGVNGPGDGDLEKLLDYRRAEDGAEPRSSAQNPTRYERHQDQRVPYVPVSRHVHSVEPDRWVEQAVEV